MKNNQFIIALIVLSITGCKANKESLELFYVEAKKQGHSEVDKLSHAMAFEVETYSQLSGRSPFVLPKQIEVMSQQVIKKDCWQPKYRNKKEVLERYSLNQLRLKGIMGFESDITALVQTPKGSVLKVRKGQFIGRNNGRVIDIKSKKIIVKETLSDGMGCWQKRYMTLVLK